MPRLGLGSGVLIGRGGMAAHASSLLAALVASSPQQFPVLMLANLFAALFNYATHETILSLDRSLCRPHSSVYHNVPNSSEMAFIPDIRPNGKGKCHGF